MKKTKEKQFICECCGEMLDLSEINVKCDRCIGLTKSPCKCNYGKKKK